MNKIFIVLFLLLSCSVKEDVRENNNKTIAFEVKQSIFEENLFNIDFSIKIPINVLAFSKQSDSFISNLTLDISILDDANINVYSHSWDENVIMKFYEDTKSIKNYLISHDFKLPSGNYFISIIANDFENHISFVNEGSFEVDDNFISKNDLDIYYKRDSQFLYYFEDLEIALDTLWFNFSFDEIKDIKDDNIKLKYEFYLNDQIVVQYKLIDAKMNSLDNSKFYPIPIINESFNKLKIELTQNNQIKSRIFNFQDMIRNDFDLTVLIGPMQYVLDFSDYLSFSDFNVNDQILYIEDFWKIKKIKELEENELAKFKEFYNRVEYANKHFSFFDKNGWKSDRGKIYIVHGEPKEIRYEFNEKGEFQFWYYNSMKNFTFINKYGTYELYNGDR